MLAHFIEDEGIATTAISLVREHTERIRPPRALWVPFELGRPLGAPDAPDFQREVLRAALALLERPAGPVIEDYPHEAPLASATADGWACPVALPAPELGEGDATVLADDVDGALWVGRVPACAAVAGGDAPFGVTDEREGEPAHFRELGMTRDGGRVRPQHDGVAPLELGPIVADGTELPCADRREVRRVEDENNVLGGQ